MSLPEIAALAGDLARRYAAPFGLTLRIEELTLAVRSNSAPVVEDLRDYFGSFVETDGARPADLELQLLEAPVQEPPVPLAMRPAAAGKRPDKERSADLPGGGRVVRKQATGMLFLFGQGANIALGPCAANRNQLVNFLCARYMERRVAAGWQLCHAAGVVHSGRALALCGFAGMGKSTLALHLVARGWDFLSNDRALVEPSPAGPLLHGIPKHPRLNPGTALGNPALAPHLTPHLARALPEAARRAYAGLAPEALRQVEDKFDADITACFGPGVNGPRFRLAAPLGGVAVLNWRPGGGPVQARRVDLRERPDLLSALRKAPGVFYLPAALAGSRQTPAACLEALAATPVLELTGGADFEAGAGACEVFLGA